MYYVFTTVQAEKARLRIPGRHRNVVLAPDDGTVILDVVRDQICCVEVLDRDDVREELLAVSP